MSVSAKLSNENPCPKTSNDLETIIDTQGSVGEENFNRPNSSVLVYNRNSLTSKRSDPPIKKPYESVSVSINDIVLNESEGA